MSPYECWGCTDTVVLNKVITHYRITFVFLSFPHVLSEAHKFNKIVYNWYLCRGFGTYFMSISRVFNPGIATDTRHWYWYVFYEYKFSAQPPILAQMPDTGIGIGRYFMSTSKALHPDIGIDIQYWYQWCGIGTYFVSTRRVSVPIPNTGISIGASPTNTLTF